LYEEKYLEKNISAKIKVYLLKQEISKRL